MKAIRIDEKILYERAVERQQEDAELRTAFIKMTANITRPGSKPFRNRYDQVAVGASTPWTAMRDFNQLVIEAGAPDEDCLAFAHAYLAWVEQQLALRDKRREDEPSLNACLTIETIEGAKQDIATAQFIANPSPVAAQKLFDRTVRLELAEGRLAGACRRVLAARGFAHLTPNAEVKQW